MNRIRTIAKAAAGAALALLLAGGALAALGSTAHAQPTPPAVFTGSVTINGQPAPAGTLIVASIGNTVCGTTVVTTPGQYTLQCSGGNVGDTVTFTVDGHPAGTGTWNNTQLNTVDLGVDIQEETPPAGTPTATPTPRGPDTGTGLAPSSGSGSGSLAMLLAAGLALAGAGASGLWALRRAR